MGAFMSLMVNLSGKKVIVTGGGKVAVRTDR